MSQPQPQWQVRTSIPHAPNTPHTEPDDGIAAEPDAADPGDTRPENELQTPVDGDATPSGQQEGPAGVDRWPETGRLWLTNLPEDYDHPGRRRRRGTDRQRSQRVGGGGRAATLVAVGVAMAGVLAAAAWLIAAVHGHHHPGRLAGIHRGSTRAVIRAAALACPRSSDALSEAVTGNGPGDVRSGPGTILWFEHEYYIVRSARTAMEVVAPGAAVSPAEVIQAGIDATPADTVYCLIITPTPGAADAWDAMVTEQLPDTRRHHYWLHVTTRTDGATTLITSITPGTDEQGR